MLRFLVLAGLAASATSSGGVFEDGPCPPIKTKANFDFNAYSGTWYEITRFPNIGEEYDKGKCTTAEYYVDGNRGKVKNTHVVDGLKTYIEGDLTLIGPAKIMLTYTFGVYSWIKSRGKTLDGNSKIAVEKFLADNSKIIDKSKYITNDHSDQTCKAYTTKPIIQFPEDLSNPNYID
ncbi:unnamed protein product, partial [Iphiclides podalirius]